MNPVVDGDGAQISGTNGCLQKDNPSAPRPQPRSLSPRERVALGAAPIMTSSDGAYRPDPAGEWAAILAVHDRFGELIDLVSWLPETPSRWWLRVGDETPVLGARALAFAADCGKPIRLFSTPEEWLRARGNRGDHVCVLNWGVDLCPLFNGVSQILCNTPGLERRLREKLRQWEPEIDHAA